jgi:hypothetical protein
MATMPDSTDTPFVCWCWNSSSDPFSKTVKPEWKPFSDIENEIIEDAYQHKEKEVALQNHIVDLKHKLQINKIDNTKQRPIWRKTNDSNPEEYTIRQSRFNVVDMPVKTFTEAGGFSKMLWEWSTKFNDSCCILSEENAPRIVELAAAGIRKEGALISKNIESDWIAKQLLKVKNKSLTDISKCCISYYTKESFLYHILNDVLRRENMAKVETLGPYSFLLVNALWNYRETNRHTRRVYRGCELTQQQINQYISDIGKVRCWAAFSSTTKNFEKAKDFGNTLFIIDLVQRPFTESFGLDISSMSKYPEEEEVLLPSGMNFIVEKVECNEKTKNYIIYLTV